MISCKRATELISKSMEEPLTLKEQFDLRIHSFICEFCQKFKEQTLLLRRAFRETKEDESREPQSAEGMSASEEMRERVKAKLHERLRKG